VGEYEGGESQVHAVLVPPVACRRTVPAFSCQSVAGRNTHAPDSPPPHPNPQLLLIGDIQRDALLAAVQFRATVYIQRTRRPVSGVNGLSLCGAVRASVPTTV